MSKKVIIIISIAVIISIIVIAIIIAKKKKTKETGETVTGLPEGTTDQGTPPITDHWQAEGQGVVDSVTGWFSNLKNS